MNTDAPQARCVTHPDNLAGGTCSRCGNFLCYVDTEGGRFTTCETCRARTGVTGVFPLNRTTYNFGALWDYCWGVFKIHWLMLSVAALIPLAISTAVSFATNMMQFAVGLVGDRVAGDDPTMKTGLGILTILLPFGLMFVSYGVLFVLLVGFSRICHDVLDGRQVEIGRLFSGFSSLGRTLLCFVVLFLGSYALGFALAAPGVGLGVWLGSKENYSLGMGVGFGLGGVGVLCSIALLMPFYMMFSELAWSEAGIGQILKNCWNAASGFRWSLALMIVVSVALAIGGTFACCIGVIPAYAMIGLLFTGLNRALRNGAEDVQPQP